MDFDKYDFDHDQLEKHMKNINNFISEEMKQHQLNTTSMLIFSYNLVVNNLAKMLALLPDTSHAKLLINIVDDSTGAVPHLRSDLDLMKIVASMFDGEDGS